MLINARHMYGMPLEGSDGRVGTLYDLLFDDQSWQLRHLVVSMDRWFLGRQVLLDPEVILDADWPGRRLRVRLTKEQVRHSPNVESDLPVARRDAIEAAHVLVWEAYWTGMLDISPEIRAIRVSAARKCSPACTSTAPTRISARSRIFSSTTRDLDGVRFSGRHP